jgi:lipopolysaccharide export system protein LptC
MAASRSSGQADVDWSARKRKPIPIGGWYDKLISALKIALPLAAVGLLVATVGWPLLNTREFSFLISKQTAGFSGERLRMEGPVYRGLDDNNRPFEIRADRAIQQTSATPIVELQGISAQLVMNAGPAKVTAKSGQYDLKTERLTLVGPINLTTADGYRYQMSEANVDLKTRQVTGGQGASGNGPLGAFEAGALKVDIDQRHLTLSDGVSFTIVQR